MKTLLDEDENQTRKQKGNKQFLGHSKITIFLASIKLSEELNGWVWCIGPRLASFLQNQYDKVVKRRSECRLYKLTGGQADGQAAPGIERLRL